MSTTGYFDVGCCDISDFTALTSQTLSAASVPFAADVVYNVPVYDVPMLEQVLNDPDQRQILMAEWAWVLGQSAGCLALRGAYPDTSVIDQATAAYEQIIMAEKRTNGGGADHFAKAGANDRVWNSLQKLCHADPALFLRYFANDAIAAVCEAWLGPCYQMSAQINLVRPGGAAQSAHRDYHLGFQTETTTARFPAHVHDLSAIMTLQGAVAHVTMPIESGTTKLLPFSQLYRPGYMAYRQNAFRAHFEAHHVQLPLAKGDALFFNPALLHAGGENRTTDVQRMVNLLQVSSAFGRAMESINRDAMCRLTYPAAQNMRATQTLTDRALTAAIAATAEGYAFPTNLDTDPPTGGLAPETQAQLYHRALRTGMTPAQFNAALDAQTARRQA